MLKKEGVRHKVKNCVYCKTLHQNIFCCDNCWVLSDIRVSKFGAFMCSFCLCVGDCTGKQKEYDKLKCIECLNEGRDNAKV